MTTYSFYRCCVDWPESDVLCDGGLSDLINQRREITRRTFLQHVNRDEQNNLEQELGYGPWLHMASDWAVEYFRSKLHGKRVYGFRHSAIEYVFTQSDYVED